MNTDNLLNAMLIISVFLLGLAVYGIIRDSNEYNKYVDRCGASGNKIVRAGYDELSDICVNKDYQIVEIK